MKHPESEVWMGWLYGEVAPEERRDLEAHLAVCSECQGRVDGWRRTMGRLDEVAVPCVEKRPKRAAWSAPHWAAVAAGLVLVGFLAGRLTGVSRGELASELGRNRAAWMEEVEARTDAVRRETWQDAIQAVREEQRGLALELLREVRAGRLADRAEWVRVVEGMDLRRGQELVALREGLAELASHTGVGFETAQTQMRLLAGSLATTSYDEPLKPLKKP
ncbi:MAG: zf-HC2 domain-containing protein [Verrucomicrobiales bacterium]|nr:zf-HC2 domain-containing protein [Verrucomicrobiales bacterium]